LPPWGNNWTCDIICDNTEIEVNKRKEIYMLHIYTILPQDRQHSCYSICT
jgi:hypothetical protein